MPSQEVFFHELTLFVAMFVPNLNSEFGILANTFADTKEKHVR